MTKLKVGFLHPGDMGISLAATARNSGHIACWVSAGRSRETQFHMAAAEIYRRSAHFKDAPERPSLEAVLEALLGTEKSHAA